MSLSRLKTAIHRRFVRRFFFACRCTNTKFTIKVYISIRSIICYIKAVVSSREAGLILTEIVLEA